ncbi:MAG: hypothetical protein IJN29_05305, partial [Akkermansia sp.]|nr:hypothetical protein [Akkermansia sp.]
MRKNEEMMTMPGMTGGELLGRMGLLEGPQEDVVLGRLGKVAMADSGDAAARAEVEREGDYMAAFDERSLAHGDTRAAWLGGDVVRAMGRSVGEVVDEAQMMWGTDDSGELAERAAIKTRQDAQRYVWRKFSRAVVRGHEERERKKQDLQRELDDVQGLLADALPRYALGEDLSPELMDRMQKYGRPDEVFPSLKRARAAVELVRGWNYGGRSKADYEGAVQARFERLREADVQPVTSGGNLVSETKLQRMHTDDELMQQARADEGESYAVTREQMATLADVLSGEDGQLDEGALGAFLLAIDADAQGQQTVDSRFVRNAVEAMKGSLMGAVDYLNRGSANTGMIWQGPDMPPIYLDAEGRESYARAYSDNVETLRGHLAQLEGRRLDAAEKAKLHSWLLTKGGTIVGENVPYLVAGAVGKAAQLGVVGTAALGGLVNAPASMNRSIGQAYAEGKKNAEFVGSVKGLAQSWAEAAFVPLPGGTAIVNGALDSLARKAISLPGAGKVIGAVWGNGLLRYVSTTAGASAGELLGEEVLAQTVQYPVLAFARAAGMDLDAPEWQPFADSWQMFNDAPRQAAATVVYCALMGAAGAPANVQAARDFAKEYRNLMAAGLKPESARRLSLQAGQAASMEDMEALCADMQETYRREVREGDPVAVQRRLRKEGESFLEEVEVQMYARSGVRDYVLKRAGILAGEKTAAGLNRISLPNKETPDKPTVLEWTDEQLNAWVEMQHESKVVETMRELQARVAGAALGDAAVDEADFKGVLVNLRELPVRALARMERTGGRVTYDVLKDLAADAREQVAGFVEGGMSEHEAYQQMSEIPGVRLGTLVNAAEGFTQRVEAIVGTPEGDALGITRPEDASTSVFRLNGVAPGQSVLLFNKGLATEREMVEDLIERDVIAATSGEHVVTTLAALEKMLRRVQSHLVRYEGGMRLLPKDKAASEMDIVEAFSKLAQSRFLLNHEQYSMPQEAHDTIEYVQKKLAHTQHLVALSRAWDAFARSEEGRAFIEKEGATLEKLMSDAGASVAGQYSRARFDADAFEAVRLAYEMSVASPEAAQETLREYEAEQQELDHPQEQEGSIPASASITGEALPLFDSEPVNQETGEQQLHPGEAELSGGNFGRSLAGERYVEVGDGSVLGVAEVGSISLSDDVPQFKKKESAAGRVAADEDGTTHELSGGWNANSAPIHVWRRTDGRLEVISGRHRLAHARKNGVKFIQVRVYDESAARDAAWAKLHDVEQNILDNTCNAIDVAYYFRHNPLTLAEAEARGLLPKTQAGEQTAASRIGLTVAARASEDTFALLVNGRCTADEAYMACLIASSEDGQRLALESRAGKNGKKNGWEYVTALVRGAEQMQPEDGGMLDLFGNDDSFRESSEKLARYVAAVREGLKARLGVLMSAGRLNKKGDVSKELGVKVKTPRDATRLIERLANLDAAYERLDPDLGIPAKAEAWDGKSAVPTKLDELAAGSSFSVIGQKAKTWDRYKERAFKGRDDGMLRAEIDASGARYNETAFDSEATLAFRRILLDSFWEEHKILTAEEDHAIQDYATALKDKKDAELRLIMANGIDVMGTHQAAYKEAKKRAALLRLPAYTALEKAFESQGVESISKRVEGRFMDEIAIDFADRADRESDSVHDTLQNIDGPLFLPLSEVLHYPELYEAYPQLADVEVYQRYAGEIESRNVERRMDWSAKRRAAAPFNETLEYPGEALVSFSIQSIMTDWSAELDNFVQNPPVHKSAAWDADVYVCPTPAVMQMVGALPRDMVMSHHVLAKVLDEHTVLGNGQTTGQMYGKEKDMGKHQLTVAELRKLPLALANPVCIAVSNHKGSIEVITDMEENGINVLVAVRLDASLRSTPKLVVNRITSLYGKKKIEQLVKHPMLYVNTAKAHRWMVDRGLLLPTVTKLSAGSTGRILTPEDLVKYKFATGQSFSLSGRGMIDAVDLGVMAREGQMQRLVSHARREAARWERTFAKDTPNAKAAEAMGTISSIQAAILRVLPPKYRPALAAQMRYVEVYARMLESGRVRAYGKLKSEELAALKEELGELLEADLALVSGGIWYDEKVSKAEAEKEAQKMLTRELGAEKLAQAAARMLNDAADAVERWMIDVELERVERMKERLAPRKLPNGKYDKGKMSADAYKIFERYCKLMEQDADTVSKKMHDLEALIAAEEREDEPDADRLDKLASQMAELAAYGNLKGKSLEAVRRGVAALTVFVQSERNVWQGKLERERERAKRSARVMSELMGPGDEVKLAENAEKSEETLRMFGDMGAGFKSLAQMFYGMGGIPGLRDLMDESLEALAHGNVQLGMREQRAYDQLGEFLEKQLGLDTETKRNDWMARLKKRVDTKVQRAGELVVHKLELTQEEAEGWLELDKAGREEKRRALLDAAEKSGVDAVNVVYEEDIPLLRDELAKFDDLPGKRKFIRTERRWRKEQSGNIVASRDEILNILLLCEQAEYQQAADENGYTAEVLAKLREVVGEDVMAFGHEMRKVLEGSGLATV